MTPSQNNFSDTFLAHMEANKGILYKVSRTYCKNEEEVKDLVQEITIQVWKAFPRYKTAYKFSTWLYRIALNVAISSYRKEKTRSQINGPMREDFVQIADRSATDQNENIQQLYSLIGKLKSMDRALMLLYLEEKSHAEIAEIMGISSTNVATKISRLKKHLKENFVK